MIERQAFRFAVAALLVMAAATLWRLSLLAQPPRGLALFGWFAMPFFILMQMALAPFIRWASPPGTSRPSLRRWSGRTLAAWSVFALVLQLLVLARSLGLFSLSLMDARRALMLVMGVMFMMVGNFVPKTPVPAVSLNPLALDAWQQLRQLRLVGKLGVGVGLGIAMSAILLPLAYWKPVVMGLMLAAFAAAIVHHLRLRREAPRLSSGSAR